MVCAACLFVGINIDLSGVVAAPPGHAVFRAGSGRWLDEEPDLEVVDQARNGRQTLQLIQRHASDVRLTDIEMPDLLGLLSRA